MLGSLATSWRVTRQRVHNASFILLRSLFLLTTIAVVLTPIIMPYSRLIGTLHLPGFLFLYQQPSHYLLTSVYHVVNRLQSPASTYAPAFSSFGMPFLSHPVEQWTSDCYLPCLGTGLMSVRVDIALYRSFRSVLMYCYMYTSLETSNILPPWHCLFLINIVIA